MDELSPDGPRAPWPADALRHDVRRVRWTIRTRSSRLEAVAPLDQVVATGSVISAIFRADGVGAKRATPLREFLRTETGGAAVLLAAAVAALVWVNVDVSSYDSLWATTLSIEVGGTGVSLELREWVNSGLMTFFFVVGLEARREFDLGELREATLRAAFAGGDRRDGGCSCDLSHRQCRSALRAWLGDRDVDRHGVCARSARAGRAAFPRPVARIHAHGRRRRRHPRARRDRDRLHRRRHDLGATHRRRAFRRGSSGQGDRCAPWVRLPRARVGDVGRVARVGRGAGRGWARYGSLGVRLSRGAVRPRARHRALPEFREQPTPELARSVGVGLRAAVSPNERLQLLFHPWTSY